jgi:hypothetical protein
VGAVVGLLLIGCATSNGDGAAPNPSVIGDDGAATEGKEADKEKPAPPPFDASFEPTDRNYDDPDAAPPNSAACIDDGDPGGVESLAKGLADTNDCEDEYKTVSGVAKGAVDVDFYKLSAKDEGPSFSHPTGCSLDTDFQAETAGTELCVFMRCKNSVDAVTGCDQGTPATSALGMKGCCVAGPGRALPTWDCPGVTDNDSVDIFLRVRQLKGDKCLPYKFRYRF